MFEYLNGTLVQKAPTEVVVDCGGVGYLLHVSLTTFSQLGEPPAEVKLFVHPHYAENVQRLYGFFTAEERTLYRLVQGVRGIGPALALNLLSHERPELLVERLRSGDVTALTRVKGVGRKTAERLLVELKDRLPAMTELLPGTPSHLQQTLVQALVSLGLNPSEAVQRSQRALEAQSGEADLEILLRLCLQDGARGAGRA